jgi:rod shape-determining protein MreC
MFRIDRSISDKLFVINTNIKEAYLAKFTNIQNLIAKYFHQTEQIVQLKEDAFKNEKYKLLYLTKCKLKSDLNSSLSRASVISYINFNDFSEVIFSSKLDIKNISALITDDGYSAGIIKKENQNIGYLNHHPKSNYAVFIGKNKVPGITHGKKDEEYITIKYAPLWQEISIGDEVITSGMDNIFPKGIQVGDVVSIKKLSTTWEALVKPYANVYNKNYFYIYSNQ